MRMYGGGQGVFLTRDCSSVQIPDGILQIIPEGSQVYITQVLGGMFTVETEMGYLARVDGKDADALGQKVPDECLVQFSDDMTLTEKVWAQLKTCYDPEIPVNIVDLGLIYDCQVVPHAEFTNEVLLKMTLTAPGCGMGEVLTNDIEKRILEIPGIGHAQIELVFDPAWSNEMMSEAARLQLGLL